MGGYFLTLLVRRQELLWHHQMSQSRENRVEKKSNRNNKLTARSSPSSCWWETPANVARLRSVLVNGRLRSMLFVVTAKPIRSELGVGGMGEAWPSPKYLSCCWDQLEEEELVVVTAAAAGRLDCGGVGGRWWWDLLVVAGATVAVTLAGVCGDAGGVGDPGETPWLEERRPLGADAVEPTVIDDEGGEGLRTTADEAPLPRRWQSAHCIRKRVTASRGRKA